jgi:hypothetical protein
MDHCGSRRHFDQATDHRYCMNGIELSTYSEELHLPSMCHCHICVHCIACFRRPEGIGVLLVMWLRLGMDLRYQLARRYLVEAEKKVPSRAKAKSVYSRHVLNFVNKRNTMYGRLRLFKRKSALSRSEIIVNYYMYLLSLNPLIDISLVD